MVQRQSKRTDQEWMQLIQECRASGLSDRDWCERHSIPASTFYNKISTLRKKACKIPTVRNHSIHEPQQVIPLEILDESPLACTQTDTQLSDHAPAIVLNMHGYSIEIANHAAKDTIINTLSALRQLC